jgi:hypothetical protein
VKKLILALMLTVFVLGLWATAAMADAILFPWLAKSSTVLTMLSVVNTSDKEASCTGALQLHYEYWVKDAVSPTSVCTPSSFSKNTSINDIVTFDASGTVNNGGALFNDQPPYHGMVTYTPNTFAMPSQPAPARAFLIVDNNNSECFENSDEASLYGEALVIQINQGAAWGYVAYNGTGGGDYGPAEEPLSFNDGIDLQGEVMRSPRYFDDASDADELEATPVVLLPLGSGPGSVFKTKFFVTPINYALWEYGSGSGTREGDSNSRIQFCLDPSVKSQNFPLPSTCPSSLQGQYLSNDSCQKNSDPVCRHAGIYDNDEGELDGNPPVDVVCTAALDISDNTPGQALLTQGQRDYLSTDPGGQAWTYVRSMVGSFWPTDGVGGRDLRTESDSIIGKLEYQDNAQGLSIGNSGTISGAVNDFKWIRNSGSQLCDCNFVDGQCIAGPGSCDWDLLRGINKVVQDDLTD